MYSSHHTHTYRLWSAATQHFTTLLHKNPNDTSARIHRARAQYNLVCIKQPSQYTCTCITSILPLPFLVPPLFSLLSFPFSFVFPSPPLSCFSHIGSFHGCPTGSVSSYSPWPKWISGILPPSLPAKEVHTFTCIYIYTSVYVASKT